MKKLFFLLLSLVVFNSLTLANSIDTLFQEDFESYSDGSNLAGQGGWTSISGDLKVNSSANFSSQVVDGFDHTSSTYVTLQQGFRFGGFTGIQIDNIILSTSINPASNLRATASGLTKTDLSWTDNSTNETGFKIERSVSTPDNFTLLTTTSANDTTYTDSNVNINTTYYYRIKATNGSSDSKYSNQVLAFTHIDGACANGNFTESQSVGSSDTYGLALGDLDADGDLDAFLAVEGFQANKIWLNNGSGNFTDSGQSLGSSNSFNVALADLDGDGDLDAFVANASNPGAPNKVWFNDGSGNFNDSGQSLGNSLSQNVALGDIDGDGDIDAFVANQLSQPNKVWINDGNGEFSDSGQDLGSGKSIDVALADLDGDGDLDAFVANFDNEANKIWLNNGEGNFSDSGLNLGSANSLGIALADLDGDDDLDAFITNDGSGNKVWLNNGNADFTDSGQSLGSSNSFGVALKDLDNDGDLDAFVTNKSNQANIIWLNDGNGNFEDSGFTFGNSDSFDIELGDLNNDGILDAFIANNSNQAEKVWHGQSEMYTDSGQGFGNNLSYKVKLADLDSDGDLDAFVVNFGSANKVLLNDGNGNFTETQNLGSSDSRDVRLGDLDADGDIDAFVANWNGQSNKLWLNNGDGSFTDSGQSLGSSSSAGLDIGDVDNDGDLDVCVANNGANKIWINDGNGNLSDSGQNLGSLFSRPIELWDLDGDGNLDIFVGNAGAGNRVYFNNGAGVFTDSGQSLGSFSSDAIVLGDFDNDNDLDVYEGNFYTETNKVWLNNGNGNFSDSGQNLGSQIGLGLDLADLDGDGDLDVFVGNADGTGVDPENRVWLNNGSGNFTESESIGNSYTLGIALGDMNGDGRLDVFTSNQDQPNKVYFGRCNFKYLPKTPTNLSSIAVSSSQIDLNWTDNSSKETGFIIERSRTSNKGYAEIATVNENVTSYSDTGLYANLRYYYRVKATNGDGNSYYSISTNAKTPFLHQASNLLATATGLNQITLSWKDNSSGESGFKIERSVTTPDNFTLLTTTNPNDIIFADTSVITNTIYYYRIIAISGSLEAKYSNQVNTFTHIDGACPNAMFTDSGQSLGSSGSRDIKLVDLDNDGDLDAFVTNTNSGANKIWINNGNGSYTDSGQNIGSSSSTGVDLGDLDGDGDLDAFVVNHFGEPNKVWLNNGSGNFSDSGQSIGNSSSNHIKLGDLDGDGDLDAFVTNNNANKVWLNDGDATFSDSGQSLGNSSSSRIAMADLDDDGDLDILVGNNSSHPNKVWLNNGSGSFTENGQTFSSLETLDVAFADLDKDGDLDAFIANASANKVWLNDGSGNFSDNGQSLGSSESRTVKLRDFDGDGDIDAFIGNNENQSNKVWLNNGSGNFTDSGQSIGSSSTLGVDFGDLNGDGVLDVFVANFNQGNKVWFGQSEMYTDSGQTLGNSSGFRVELADLDNDGDLDAFVGNDQNQPNKVWLNDGSGNFSDNGQSLGSSHTQDLALGDLDGDGDIDAVIANNQDQANKVWLNDGNGNFSDSGQNLNDMWSYAVRLGDFDNDGDLDAFVANNKGLSDKIWINDGNGNFSDSGQNLGSSYAVALAIDDLDNDGDLDAIVNNSFDFTKVWLNDGNGNFSDSGQSFGASYTDIELGDVDNDGDIDAFTGGFSTSALWLNDGNGNFSDSGQSFNNTSSYGMTISDIDSDGDLDVIVGDAGTTNSVWLNNGSGIFSAGQGFSNSSTSKIVLGDLNGDEILDVYESNFGANKIWLGQCNSKFLPITPSALTATSINSTYIDLNWSDNSTNETGFKIERSLTSNNGFTVIGTVGAGITNYQDHAVDGGKRYYYRVKATNNDGDSYPSIITSAQNSLFTKINSGDIITDQQGSYGSAWGDYDNDGDQDLFVANDGGGNNYLYQNNGNGTFTKITSGPIATEGGLSVGGTWGDYDNDGDLDLFVSNYSSSQNNFFYQNDGDGTFTKITSLIIEDAPNSRSIGCSWIDYNNDGHLDLLVTNDGGTDLNNFLFKNEGDGSFTKISDLPFVTDGGESQVGSWADYNNDGHPDLFIGNTSGKNYLYKNNGDGSFTKLTTGVIESATNFTRSGSWADYDNDGDPDLFVANYLGANSELFRNDGNDIFTKMTAGEVGSIVNDGGNSHGSSWADYDNDGYLDLFIANPGTGGVGDNNFLYHNDGDGSFTKITDENIVSEGGISISGSWADYNNDGFLDLFVGNLNEDNFLYENNNSTNNWVKLKLIGSSSNNSAIGTKIKLKANDMWQLREISSQTDFVSQNSLVAQFGLGNAASIDSIKIEWPSGRSDEYLNVIPNQLITYEESGSIPIAQNDAFSTDEDSELTNLNLFHDNGSGEDSDPDGDTFSVSEVNGSADNVGSEITLNSGALITVNTDGIFSYNPNNQFENLQLSESNTDSLTYKVIDIDGESNEAKVFITINGINDKPQITDQETLSVFEDSLIVITLSNLTVSDPDNSYPDDYTLTINSGSNYTFSHDTIFPAQDFNSSLAVKTIINDGLINSDTFNLIISVDSVNDAPSFTKGADETVLEDVGAQTVNGWATDIEEGGGADEDTQTLTFNVTNDNNDLFVVQPTVDATTGDLTYTPADNANGETTVTINISDDGGTANGGDDTSADQTFTITVTAVNDAPSFTKGADETVLEDAGAQTVNGWATDIEEGGGTDEDTQTLTFNVSNNNNDLFVVQPAVDATTGDLTYTPAENANGEATVSINISDDGATLNGGDDTSADQTFTITVTAVNDAPSFTKGADETVLEDAGAQTVNGWATDIEEGGGADEDTQTLTFNVSNDNNGLFVVQPTVDATTGDLTYTPADNANGETTVTINISDDGGTANGGDDTSADQTFTITVTAVNDAPSFTKGADETVLEDAGAQTVNGWATDMEEGGGADEDTQTLTFNVTNDNNGLFVVQPTVDASTGALTYTPADNANGEATVSVQLTDDGGIANDGVDSTAVETFIITVTAVNDEPSFTKGADETVLEDAGAQTVNGWATDIEEGGGADEDTQTLTFNLSNDNNGLFVVQPTVDATTGDLTYTPADNANGETTVTINISDDGGTANGGDDTSADQTFTITVTAVNDAPSFTKGADETVLEDAGAQTVNGWATDIEEGGGTDEDTQTLTFNVSNNNNDLFVVQPAVDATTGDLTYTPAENANGEATVSINISDDGATLNGGDDTSADQTFTITVTAVNDAPSFTKGADETVLEDAGAQTVNGWATDIEEGGGADEDTQTLTFNVSNDNNGLFVVQPTVDATTGDLTYTPADNANGETTVTINISDDGGTANGGDDTSADQTFTITVTAVNDAPSFTKGADETVLEDAGAQTVNGWATDMEEGGGADEDTQTLTFNVTNDNNGLFVVQPTVDASTGALTYTPADNANGEATVSVQLTDDGGIANDGVDSTAVETFIITVTAVNDEPSFTKGADETVLEDAGAQTVNGWATDIEEGGGADEDTQTLTFNLSNDNNGLFVVQPTVDATTGDLTYTPADNANGETTVTINISDDGGTANGGDDTSADQTFTITVTAVNDAPSFTKGADETVLEDAGAQTVNGWATDIEEGGGADEDTQTLTFNVTNDNNDLFVVQPTVDATTGDLTYTPADNANGEATVTINISDDGGTANGGDDTSADQTFTITVTAVNDGPIITSTAPTGAREDSLYSYAISVTDDDDDNNGSDLSWSLSNEPEGMIISNIGEITWTPLEGILTSGTVTAIVEDGKENGAIAASEEFTITVTPENDEPTDILLDNNIISENQPNSKIGTFTTIDVDNEIHTYDTISGEGDSDNSLFQIIGNELYSNTIFDYESKSEYSIRVITDDGNEGFFEDTFQIVIDNINEPPTGLVLEKPALFNKISMNWQDNQDEENVFIIYRSEGDQNNFDSLASVSNNTLNFENLDEELIPNIEYFYKVKARNGNGDSEFSNIDSVITPPTPPSNLSVSEIFSNQIDLNWQDNSENENSFRIEYSTNDNSNFIFLDSTEENVTTYQHTQNVEPNTTYYYRVYTTNENGDSNYSNETEARSMLEITQSLPALKEFNSDTIAFIEITDGRTVKAVKFFYREISNFNNNWNDSTLDKINDKYEISINDHVLNEENEIGLEYYFKIFSNDGIDITTDTIYLYINHPEGLTFEGLKKGNSVNDYQIVSIPLDLDFINENALFINGSDSYNKKKWRLFHYDNANDEVKEYKDELKELKAGEGYWLIIKDDVLVKTGPGNTNTGNLKNLNKVNPFEMTLQKGWNQIGNPYNFNLSWNDILSHTDNNLGDSQLEFLVWDDSGDWKPANRLDAMRGGFVFVDSALTSNNVLKVKIPVIKDPVLQRSKKFNQGKNLKKTKILNPLHSDSWQVNLTLTNPEMRYSLGGIGMHKNAKLSKDIHDRITVPRFIKYLEVNFYHPEYFMPKFTKDIVPLSENYEWEFVVESNLNQNQTSISWDNSYFGNNSKVLILHDLSSEKLVNMREQNSYSIQLHSTNKFKIYFGEQDFIDTTLKPENISLGNSFPNPFSKQTTIPFTLPESKDSYHVELAIYNMQGQKAVTLINGLYQTGFHSVTWNRKGQNGFQASSGMYIYKMVVTGTNTQVQFTKKMLLK